MHENSVALHRFVYATHTYHVAVNPRIGAEGFQGRARDGIRWDTLIWAFQAQRVADWAERFFDAPLPGLVMKAGLFPEVAVNR